MAYRSAKKSKSKGSYFPTNWSEWEPCPGQNCEQRYRLKAADDYQFEYRASQFQTEPRSQDALEPIPENEHYSESDNFLLSGSPPGVEGITGSLSRIGLQDLGPNLSSFTHSTPQSNFQSGWENRTTHIKTRNPDTKSEELDPHYKVHHAKEFKYGKVFKVLWAEPKGDNDGNGSNDGSSRATVTEKRGQKGERLFQKVRRFVVIKDMGGHCICLPINTYSGKGVMKNGVNANHHTAVYSSRHAEYIKGERGRGLTKQSIRIVPSSPRHKLDPASRMNYAKPYTVEYNVKVWFIGKVHQDFEWQLATDYNLVHPPLEARGVPPPFSPDDIFEHAQGGDDGVGGGGNSPRPPYSVRSGSYPLNSQNFPGNYQQPTSSWVANTSVYGPGSQTTTSLADSRWSTASQGRTTQSGQTWYPNTGAQTFTPGSTVFGSNTSTQAPYEMADPRSFPDIGSGLSSFGEGSHSAGNYGSHTQQFSHGGSVGHDEPEEAEDVNEPTSAPIEAHGAGPESEAGYDPNVYDGPAQSGDDAVPEDSASESDLYSAD